MKNNLVHQFSQIPAANVPRSRFSRPHTYKTTLSAGKLIPFFLDWALPSDTFDLRSKFLLRFTSPLIAPIMDNVYCDVFYFAVPFRLVWDNWERFCGQRNSPDDRYEGVIPKVLIPAKKENAYDSWWPEVTVADYFGIPVHNLKDDITVNALPFRALNLIYNEWFRDENLMEPANVYRGDETRSCTDYPLLPRGKRHDYATSALPWPQKGPDGMISIGGVAPVYGDGNALKLMYETNGSRSFATLAPHSTSNSGLCDSQYLFRKSGEGAVSIGDNDYDVNGLSLGTGSLGVTTESGAAGLVADLSSVNPIPINDLRRAVALQHWFERLSVGGSRYTEIVRSVFGTVSPDARLQRPEYLGGGTFAMDFQTVEQTSATGDGTTPQGNLAAFGLGGDANIGFTKSFTEHCVVIGLLSVRADLSYQQALSRFWRQDTLESLYWPQFAHLGEQAIESSEIYCDGTDADKDVFGYQERYAEYRYKPSLITGQLNSAHPYPLDAWHLAQYFANRPVLNEEFIIENPPIDRVVSITSEPPFLLDSSHELICARPMPMYGTPGLDRL